MARVSNSPKVDIYLKNIIERIPAFIFWKNSDSVYIGCNHRFANLVGKYNPDEIIGKTDLDLGWRKEERELFRQGDIDVMNGHPKINVEETLVTADGNTVVMLVSKVPLRDEYGNCIGVLGISMDISDRKKLENDLLQAKEKAEQANDLKTKFIQNMQHDVRTPLAGVYQYMETWADEETDEEKKYCAQLMRSSTGQLLNMCNELVDFENIDYLGDKLTLEVVETERFLSRVIDLNKMAAHSQDLEIYMMLDPKVPPRLKLDRKKLFRALVNLIGNSLKFTEEGSVVLYVKVMELSSDKAKLAFEIHDTGIGIPADKIELIFDKFVRLSPSNQAKYKGSGLGLFYVKKFVDDMNGKLEVESLEGKGSIFRITLDLSIPDVSEEIIVTSYEIDTFVESVYTQTSNRNITKKPKTIAPTKSATQHKILLIEDDILQQKMISKIVHNVGEEVVKVVDSVALSCEAIAAQEYDLIISDLGIIGGSGIDVMKWAKQDKKHPNQMTPFVALTANNDATMKQLALNSGFLNVYQKPLTPQVAQNIFTQYLAKNKDNKNLAEPIIDIEATLSIGTDMEMLEELFAMFSQSIVKDRQQLQSYYMTNNIKSTRELLHRLDGTLRYCVAPKLQRARGLLHDGVRNTTDLTTIEALYRDFYAEIDQYLMAYQQFKQNGFG